MWLITALLLTATLSWRWAESFAGLQILALIAAIAAIVASWRIAPGRGTAVMVAGLATLVALIKLVPAWWPCELACQGLEGWGQIGSVPVPALAALVLVAFGAVVTSPIGRRCAAPFSWLLVGGSLSYLTLMLMLEIWCFHCLAIHGAILCLPGCCRPTATGDRGSSQPWAWLLAGMIAISSLNSSLVDLAPQTENGPDLLPNIEFRPGEQVISDEFRQQPQHDMFLLAADAGRRLGSHEAPWRLEVVLSLHCSHCRLRWPALRDQLMPLVNQGQLQVVIRHRWQPNDPDQQSLMAVLWTAAASGQHGAWLMRALAPAAGNEALSEQLQRKHQVHTAVQQMVSPGIERLLRLELFWLRQQRVRSGPLPAGILFRQGQAKAVAKFSGSWGITDVGRYVDTVRE